MQRITWIKSEYQIKTKSTCYNSGPRYLQIQHATINLLNAKIHLELHWSIEWKLEVNATFPGKVSTKEQTEIRFNTRRLNRWMQRITWIKFEYRIETKSNCYNSGPKYPLQKRKRRSDSIRHNKFIELTWIKLGCWIKTSSISYSFDSEPRNKWIQMPEQNIGYPEIIVH